MGISKTACFYCDTYVGFKTDSHGRLICAMCIRKRERVEPMRIQLRIGRNQLCDCGSGLKAKRCCYQKVRV